MSASISALRRAAQAICAAQDGDNLWRDYHLPVGVSDEWVAGYVALVLAETGNRLGIDEYIGCARQCYQSLIAGRRRHAGFGYNGHVDADADSTATILLLASALKAAANPVDISFLEQHIRDDGGVSTFRQADGWGVSHSCVTPVALLALGEWSEVPDRVMDQAYYKTSRRSDGAWDSYWWQTPLYATAAWVRFFYAMAPDVFSRLSINLNTPINSSMDIALALEISTYIAPDISDHLVEALLNTQLPNGLWPPSRTLRVTDFDCMDASNAHGCLYADIDGLMSSAMALRALSRYVSVS